MSIINSKTYVIILSRYIYTEVTIILFSTLVILAILLIINCFIYKKFILNKKLFVISSIFIITYYILSIIIYNNNILNNYEYGILYGDILNNHFCDEFRYYMDSDILLNHFKNGNFNQWFNRDLPVYEFVDPQGHPGFGNYNIFVIFLTLLKLIGFTNTLQLIIIKLIFYIPVPIILYKLSRIYLNEKFSLLTVIIFSLLPGYALTNSLLMRDNIIILLVLILLYYIFSKKFNLYILFPTILLLFFLRSYLVAILMVSYIFCFKNSKKLISKFDIYYILILILSIIFFSKTNFHNDQMRILQERFSEFFGSDFLFPIRVILNSIIHIFTDPPYISFLLSGISYLITFSLANIIGTIISLLFALKYIYLIISNKFINYIYLIKYTFYFTSITGILVISKDGYIINRIALLWLPLFIVIIFLPISYALNEG